MVATLPEIIFVPAVFTFVGCAESGVGGVIVVGDGIFHNMLWRAKKCWLFSSKIYRR